MNRHLAKAKRLDNGEWVEGYLIIEPDWDDEDNDISNFSIVEEGSRIIETSESRYFIKSVIQKTICRNTGHPNNIYEGDEVTNGHSSGFVEWNDEDLTYRVITHNKFRISFDCITDWKPTGKNIHD